MKETALRLHFRNDLGELPRAAKEVEQFGAERLLPRTVVSRINLALDEVLTNVISYAYEDDGTHEIEVHLEVEDEDVVVEVTDDGRPFDPLSVAAADIDLSLEERPIGGLGIHLVRRVMDHVEYRRDGDSNVLTMRKRIGAAP
jgi:anti-sigma regulatory factor (Ser/Thr protein kinase)